ncbi:MAG: histidine phosphatase family protein [Patescibacteria group bacterium]
MKYLILIRHGEFNEGEEKLNEKGREQIKNLAVKIKDLEPKIYSSLGPRSVESATILAEALKSESTSLELFHSIDYAREVLTLLKQIEENVVIVSRGEFVTPFAVYFTKEVFGKELEIEPIMKGEGVVFDVEFGTYAIISA